MPDPTNLLDYHRYLYARGNPLKYNDPSGHCITLGDGSPDLENDAGCWQAANEWGATFAGPGKMSAEDLRIFFSSQHITEEILRNDLYAHWHPIFQQSGLYHPVYNPPPVPGELGAYPPCCAGPIGNAVGKTVQIACSKDWWDCPGIALDATSTYLSFQGDAAIVCSVAIPGCAPVAIGSKEADVAVTALSAAYAATQYASGEASGLDAAIATASTTMSVIPVFGEVSGIGSLIWDFADPFVADEKWYGPGRAR